MGWYDPEEIKAQATEDREQPEFDQDFDLLGYDFDEVEQSNEEVVSWLNRWAESQNEIRETLGID